MASRFVIVLIALVAAPALVAAFSGGAPKEACGDMVPQHHVDAQKGKSPYSLLVSKKSIRSGDVVQLTLKGNTASDTFKGLLVQARVGNQLVGQFTVPANNPYIQVVDCGNGSYNAVTHKKISGSPPNSVSFTWQAPQGLAEEVTFQYTTALNGGVFWVGEKSEKIRISN